MDMAQLKAWNRAVIIELGEDVMRYAWGLIGVVQYQAI